VSNLQTCTSRSIDSQPTRPDHLTHYIIVNPDLPRGILAAQVTHAAGESSPGSLPEGTNAVVLAAKPLELQALEVRLKAAGVPHTAIREPDPPYNGELLAIGLVPAARSLVRSYVSSLPLLKEEAPLGR
jgi:peptidyl-tRNA hydrolase